MGEMQISKILNIDTIELIQGSFTRLTGVGAQIFDGNGEPVTSYSSENDFCRNKRKADLTQCMHCKHNKIISLNGEDESEKLYIHRCKSGLIDFTTYIEVEGEIIGIFYVGQVATTALNEEEIRQMAIELGIEEEEYLENARKLPICTEEKINDIQSAMMQLSKLTINMVENVVSNNRLREEAENVARQKSDFLANMSHEIRTPMNAVIGMAEMALRENVPERAKEYLYQIKTSGKTLLTIINDVLDFSKIESGKMEIMEEEYEILSVINDIINIVYTRIGDKNIEFLVDVNPQIPYSLIGDSIRLKQIIVNLTNNAVKFTPSGAVTLKIDYEDTEDGIELIGSVIDTGIGIKQDKIGMLFQSFQQLDSKRNRNVEGTGLGLALTQRLLNIMNGSISVKSVYEKGSTFTFRIPQKVGKTEKCVHIHDYKNVKVAGFFNSFFLEKNFRHTMEQFQVGTYYSCVDQEDINRAIEEKVDFFFIEYAYYSDTIKEQILANGKTECCIVVDSRFQCGETTDKVSVIQKPIYVLNVAATLNHEKASDYFNPVEKVENTFVIPEAEILIVDDNAVNLTVAEGLLRVFMAQITKAQSGKESIELVTKKKYDLIFMDHMMPEMDGVEATHKIRELGGWCKDVPIVALTANAMSEARGMFLKEGLNDFVAKPIEMREITECLRKWIPKEKQIMTKNKKMAGIVEDEEQVFEIAGLNTSDGRRYTGNLNLYKQALKDYYLSIEAKASKIESFENAEDIENYTIEVHALKSASKMIGANELAKLAERMEECGHNKEWKQIHNETIGMLALYRSYIPILAPYAASEKNDVRGELKIQDEVLFEMFEKLEQDMEDLNLVDVEATCNTLRNYKFDGDEERYFHELLTCAETIDFEQGMKAIDSWREYRINQMVL